jgi:putative ABC transport system permease protein
VVLAIGFVLLAFARPNHAGYIIAGTIASVVGMLLLAPLAIQGVARLAGSATISLRLALRDLARYQARSGAALGAATLAIAIAATIAISAAAAQPTTTKGNLPANEMVVYVGEPPQGPGSAIPELTAAQSANVTSTIDQLRSSLHAQAVELDAPYNPNASLSAIGPGPESSQGGRQAISLARVIQIPRGEEINQFANLYVATPQVLSHFGIDATQLGATTDIVTSRTDTTGMTLFDPSTRSQAPKPSTRVLDKLPAYDSEPRALITPSGMRKYGLRATPAAWLVRAPAALTAKQIDTARRAAASAGLVIETRSAPTSLAPLRNWSTVAGFLVALGVLAMTVGLIRSEAGRDLRTLTATGASSRTRRTITGATTGTLALLGALLGVAGAYGALMAWHRSELHLLKHEPWVNLVLIVIALPVTATATGWLLAGREPPAMSRQPLE